MASASAQKFMEFSPEYDDWQIYAERLEQHFTASKIKENEDSIKVAILISSLAPSTYKLLRDLTHPQLPKEKSFDELSTLLQNQFSNQINIWRERKKFYETRQNSEESVAEWYAKLKSAATNCSFGARLSHILRDRFLTGMCTGRILDRLCEEAQDAPLDELMKLAVKVESISKIEGEARVNFMSRNSKVPPKPNGYGGNVKVNQHRPQDHGRRTQSRRHDESRARVDNQNKENQGAVKIFHIIIIKSILNIIKIQMYANIVMQLITKVFRAILKIIDVSYVKKSDMCQKFVSVKTKE